MRVSDLADLTIALPGLVYINREHSNWLCPKAFSLPKYLDGACSLGGAHLCTVLEAPWSSQQTPLRYAKLLLFLLSYWHPVVPRGNCTCVPKLDHPSVNWGHLKWILSRACRIFDEKAAEALNTDIKLINVSAILINSRWRDLLQKLITRRKSSKIEAILHFVSRKRKERLT